VNKSYRRLDPPSPPCHRNDNCPRKPSRSAHLALPAWVDMDPPLGLGELMEGGAHERPEWRPTRAQRCRRRVWVRLIITMLLSAAQPIWAPRAATPSADGPTAAAAPTAVASARGGASFPAGWSELIAAVHEGAKIGAG
jgi:hypothetical protein